MALTFLNLGALFGLAAVSIPIIIHFLNRLQVKEVTWAAMRFLRESMQKNRRRLQIEDLLLLVLRCLLIILLILALSQPALRSGPAALGSHQATAVIILDDSYSMGLTNGITTSFQRGQSAAEQILAAFPVVPPPRSTSRRTMCRPRFRNPPTISTSSARPSGRPSSPTARPIYPAPCKWRSTPSRPGRAAVVRKFI